MNRLLTECNLDGDGDLLNYHRPRDERITEAIAFQAERVGHTIRRGAAGSE